MCREHRTKLNALMTSNCDLSYWLSFNIPNEWISSVCERLSGCLRVYFVCACKRYRMQTKTHTEEQSYKSKWWHFSLCALGCCAVLSYAVCAACFKNRMCSIRDRNHIVCIILILFCGSCCSWLFRGMYVFVCLYFAIIDLH